MREITCDVFRYCACNQFIACEDKLLKEANADVNYTL